MSAANREAERRTWQPSPEWWEDYVSEWGGNAGPRLAQSLRIAHEALRGLLAGGPPDAGKPAGQRGHLLYCSHSMRPVGECGFCRRWISAAQALEGL